MRIALLLVLVAACGRPQSTTETLLADGFDRVDIRNASGQVQVSGGAPSGGEATLSWRGKIEPELTSRVAGSSLLINGVCPDKSKACDIDLSLTVPPSVDVDISNALGDVAIGGVDGVVDIGVDAGDVLVDGADGNVRVDVDSGDIVLSGVQARLELSIVAGTLVGTDVSSPTVDINVVTGSVDLTFDAMPELVEIATDDGDITLRLPPGDYDIDASSRKGQVEILDVTNTASASAVIILSSETGDIRITGP